MVLLQTTVDGMADVTFTLKDVIYILTIVLSIAGMFFNLRSNNKAVHVRLKNNEIKQKEDNQILHNRIEKTQDEMKDYMKKTDEEFKEINQKLSDINSGLGEIKGLLKK